MPTRYAPLLSAIAVLAHLACIPTAAGQTKPIETPPRSVTDITTIIEQEKPDPVRLAKVREQTEREPPAGASPNVLARFYLERSEARQVAGRLEDARADIEHALALDKSKLDARTGMDVRVHSAWLYRNSGQMTKAIAAFKEIEKELDAATGMKGRHFTNYKHLVACLIFTGNLAQAETYVAKAQALAKTSQAWPAYAIYGSAWDGQVQEILGQFYMAKGQYGTAEEAFGKSEDFVRKSVTMYPRWEHPPVRARLEYLADYLIMLRGRAKAAQGRLVEGEADIRHALLNQLKSQGKYNASIPLMLAGLANTLTGQGRYADAEKVMRTAIQLYRELKIAEDSNMVTTSLQGLAGLLTLQNRWAEAREVYRELEQATKTWEPRRRQILELNAGRIFLLFNAGNPQEGLPAAQAFLEQSTSQFGDTHFNTAAARGVYAIGLARTGNDAAALEEFKKSVAVLLSATHETDDEDASVTTASQGRVRGIVESYIALLARRQGGLDAAAIEETFRLGESVRGSSVQRALTSASARMALNNPAFGDLARKEQDLEKQRNALLSLLNSVIALAPEEREEKVIAELRKQIEVLRAERATLRKEIDKRFPRYADLINPLPPGTDEIRRALKPGEVFVSFYFGNRSSFVWAVPKEGAVAFTALSTTLEQIEDRVSRIRAALEASDVPTLADIPNFHFDIAHGLYNLLLKPVEGAWRGAKSIVVASNGALGMLPLGLLTTEPFTPSADEALYFASYRKAPWLARTHAVTLVPSAAALRTLRGVAPGAPRRDKLIGFGDPIFSKEQAKEAGPENPGSIDQRGVRMARRSLPKLKGVDTAELDRLPRLPDTADELKAIAIALQLDPAKVLHLGKEANERIVKQANLTQYRVVAFATHGLVPGELNGLTQPALALSAPDVADVDGDGLLTMDEVLALKLDADWVVLSACNTGSGVRAGAEAASGLGRAFFYAGARSLLLTNWAVYSVPASQLVSDLIRRHAADARLARAEALRQAMMALVDGPGFLDDGGKEVATFAHPVFWAPYTLVGDGGME